VVNADTDINFYFADMLGGKSGNHHHTCSSPPSPTPSPGLTHCITCNPPSIPIWPEKVLIIGDEYVLTTNGSVIYLGVFLTVYDWPDQKLREEHANIPSPETPGEFQVFFNFANAGWDTYYNLSSNSWTCYYIPDLPMTPPDYLTTTCSVVSNDVELILNQWCYKWNCPYGAINQTIWTNCQTGIIVRQYQPPIDIYPALQVDYNSFRDGTTVYADGVFPRVPIEIESIFGCPNVPSGKRNADNIGAPINFLFSNPNSLLGDK